MPNDLLRGVVIGAFLVALPSAVWVLTMQFTGTAPVMMGDEAEQWTATELRRLSRRGWRVINHVALREDDIDHVLVGPGGAYAVETKWSSSWSTSYGRDRVLEGIEQVRANARLLKLWHPLKQLAITPQPVLVMWGPGLSKLNSQDRVRVVNEVTVVVGSALRPWLRSLDNGVLSEQQISGAWSALEAHLEGRDRADSALHRVPTSVAEAVARLALAVGFAAFGIAALGQILNWTQSMPLTLSLACALTLPAGLLIPSPRWRWMAWGWGAGLGLPSAALLASELVAFIVQPVL
ncbi:nuclease-related domain-containing protein [Intrasporangium chromatireducens]|uniref:nuclease-related domain-containing protein n=1 Tax=Intrasporangium chromatireducens TaxID=1386088 RepID=UPI00138E1433|nr:nuclease-related domain-containing protein [Intrasporangium chromatireducens]